MANGDYILIKNNGTTLDEKVITAVSGKVLGFDSSLNPVMTDGGGTGAVVVHQVGHSLSVGNVIRVSSANTYVKAKADTVENAEVCGIVILVSGADDFTYSLPGLFTFGVPVQAAGTVMFLSAITAGTLSVTDAIEGQISKPLVIILESGTKALFNNFRGQLIGAAASTSSGSSTPGWITLLHPNYGWF